MVMLVNFACGAAVFAAYIYFMVAIRAFLVVGVVFMTWVVAKTWWLIPSLCLVLIAYRVAHM
jgi:hypothetical protein